MTAIKIAKYKLQLLSLVCITSIIYLEILYVHYRIQEAYDDLVKNQKLIHTFIASNDTTIQELAKQYQLEYQIIKGNTIIFSSNPRLPIPKIITVKVALQQGVIDEDVTSSLLHLQPSITFSSYNPYIFFPIISKSNTTNGYIVYKKLLP